jgi:transposase
VLAETRDSEEIIPRVAALDIGKAELVCCVRVPDEDRPGWRLQEVQTYSTMTRSLLGMADRLRCLGVTRVVMEATSDYWKCAFYLLEAAGFEAWLVNAKDVKHLPGRPKTDPLTELPEGIQQLCGRMGILVATVADHDHRRRCAAGPGRAGDAAGRVA